MYNWCSFQMVCKNQNQKIKAMKEDAKKKSEVKSADKKKDIKDGIKDWVKK